MEKLRSKDIRLMHPKNLLISICLVAGICIGEIPAQAQSEDPVLPESSQTEMTPDGDRPQDWSQLAIEARDLPPGFQGMPAEDIAKLKQELRENDLPVESVFAFMEPNNFELLLGLTTPLKNQQSQTQFEQILQQPEVLRELVTDGMGSTQILEQVEIDALDDMGESVAGVTLKLNMEGVPAQLDIVAFQRESIGAFMFLLYLDGQTPRMPIVNLARTLDNRAVEMLTEVN